MPLVHFTSDHNRDEYAEGAFCPLGDKDRLVIWKTHHGLCVKEREANGYHDSDFYMTVYEPETDTFKEVLFASTRGWCYPCFGSSVDATPEVLTKYNAWRAEQQRRWRVQARWNERRQMNKDAQAMGITRADAWKLRRITGSHYEAVRRLLTTKKFRSDFRASLAKQIRGWLSDQSPKYQSPLSPRQMEYL